MNWEGLAAHVILNELGSRETVLEGVTRVLPGEHVELGGDELHPTLLWNAVDIARSPAAHDASEAQELLKEAVRASSRAWASCYDSILLRLSGGVDSSILLACLAPLRSTDVVCVNYHSKGSDSDERHFARLAAAQAGRDLVECERAADFNLERVLSMASSPGPVHYIGWMNGRTDAELARSRGASALFTGAGGDQLFFEFPRWWPAADYLQVRGLDTGFASAALDAARLGRVSVWKATALAILDLTRPTVVAGDFPKHVALGPALSGKTIARERFVHPALLDAGDLPLGKHAQTRALTYPIGYYDPFEPESAPELVNPLLSQPVVELCLRLPTYLLTQGGRGRALVRRAFAADLPREIATRVSKGGMEEHIKEVLLRNIGFARSMLMEGELVRQGLLDRAAVEELLSGRPSVLAGHVGEIHAWIGIEAWVDRWRTPRRAMPPR